MLIKKKIFKINWEKVGGMIPAIIQNNYSGEVLMHAYMNYDALFQTQKTGLVTFFSRTKNRLWVKGEKSGNFLNLVDIQLDCDSDAILVLVNPIGKSCHLNKNSCFSKINSNFLFFYYLEKLIEERKKCNSSSSYTLDLYKSGTDRIAQKLGEEAIESVIAVLKKNRNEIVNEVSDLMYHLLVLLHDQDLSLEDIIINLKNRFHR